MHGEFQRASTTHTRRGALRCLAGGLAGLFIASCTPARIAFRAYPDEFDDDPTRVDGVLRAFVTTVVPGISPRHPDVTRAFYDEFYPLAKYRGFLAADLCQRSTRLYGSARFEKVCVDHRVAVIKDGLGDDATTARLYQGAIFLTQIACLAAIYDDEGGSPLIDFDGRYRLRNPAELTFADPAGFLARADTANGNPT